MSISQDQVRHIAKLARLHLTDEEVSKFAGELSSIFSYIDQLNEVDTEGVSETAQVTGLENVTRKDEITTMCDPQELLDCSPLPKERNQIKVKSVF